MRLWLRDNGKKTWLDFSHGQPLIARHQSEVIPLLEQVEAFVNRGGYAAGFISYHAAPCFDPHLVAMESDFPYAWFVLVRRPVRFIPPMLHSRALSLSPAIDRATYANRFDRVQAHIAAGDTYQINLTFPLTGKNQDARDFWMNCRRARFGAWLEDEDFQILSASPEGFVGWRDGRIWSEPMKGTRRPGPNAGPELATDPKDRAENLMIVDMIRNDLSRIAEPGSVRTPTLFEVENHPGVVQMTSRVEGHTTAGIGAIMRAMFPCASITGAPKIHTTKLIAAIEPTGRGLYTGAIGWVGPGRGQFSVAIRTLVNHGGQLTYGVGSGVVADSQMKNEYDECLLKGEILAQPLPFPGRVVEKFLSDSKHVHLHQERMRRSSLELFGEECTFDESPPYGSVTRVTAAPGTPNDHSVTIDQMPYADRVELKWARHHMYSEDLCLRHKTTCRDVYKQFKGHATLHPHTLTDVLLYNERDEVTETTIFNVAVFLEGEWWTPAASSGLLPGIERLRLGYPERLIHRREITRETPLRVFNSVRGEYPAKLR